MIQYSNMISRYTYHDVTWVDIESPSKEEIVHVMEEFSVPTVLGEEMISNTFRSKVELYSNLIYLILHFPTTKVRQGKSVEHEIDFIIGKNFLITVRYDHIDPIHAFSKHFESSTFIHGENIPHNKANHGGYIFISMMKELYKHSLVELDELTTEIRDIEYEVFSEHEKRMVKKISHTNRKILDFKQAVRFHADILNSYESASTRLFGSEYTYYANLVSAEFNKVNSVLESNRDAISELRLTNDSLLSTRTNDIMRTFTILTFVMLPLTFITGVFGMNTVSEIIFIRDRADFFFIVAAMLLTGIIMFMFFRFRKWI